jgi:hypothetical protein
MTVSNIEIYIVVTYQASLNGQVQRRQQAIELINLICAVN